MEGDAIYFTRRAGEERVAAIKAGHPNARRVHIDLAERYDELARAIMSHDLLLAPSSAEPPRSLSATSL